MRGTLITASALALALVVACGPAKSGSGLALGAAPWKDGDKASYDVVDRSGTKLGTSVFEFAADGEAWVVSFVEKVASLDQAGKVRVEASTLRPLGEEKTLRVPGTDATVNLSYKNGKLEINAVVNGQNKQASLDVPADALENDQLLMTLRALRFAEGYEGRYTNVVGQNALKVNTTVRVKGKEEVTVPAGTFQTWRVELDFVQARQTVWYQLDAPHNMVQYDNGTTRYVLTR